LLYKKMFAFFFLIVLGTPLLGWTDCWRWTREDFPISPAYPSLIAYDESSQKVYALPMYPDNNKHLELWAYGEKGWELIWDSLPAANYGWVYMADALYYDENLAALVLLVSTMDGMEGGSSGVFKFVPAQGWIWVAGPIPWSSSFVSASWANASFDSLRKRAVITGGGDAQTHLPITIEFDGSNFYIINNPQDYTLQNGSMGFNPESGKTVFYGFGLLSDPYKLNTFEYDGKT
jgi:hypothetical protein